MHSSTRSFERTLIDILTLQGVFHFCIAPGSRSIPLTVAASEHPSAHIYAHSEERGLGFFALGLSKSIKAPVAIIVTSGSALGNLYPAVMEAFFSEIPLIILSADRPEELIGIGANQTCEQTGFFGSYVHAFHELSGYDSGFTESHLAKLIEFSFFSSSKKGPIHFNVPVREPFFGHVHTQPSLPHPITRYRAASVDGDTIKALNTLLHDHERGVILLGMGADVASFEMYATLSRRLEWPIYADISSGIRACKGSFPFLPFGDLFLEKSRDITAILHIGTRICSKKIEKWLGSQKPIHILIEESGKRYDPSFSITHHIHCSIAEIIPQLGKGIIRKSSYIKTIRLQSIAFTTKLKELFDSDSSLSEPSLLYHLSKISSGREAFFFGTSMPVRYADAFFYPMTQPVKIFTCRGVSGIDGHISQICGLSLGIKAPLMAVIGDLSFLHDTPSLRLLRDAEYPILIFVLNNDGGGIFHHLPIKEEYKNFEALIVQPHGLSISSITSAYGVTGTIIEPTISQLSQIIDEWKIIGGIKVVEIPFLRTESQVVFQNLRELCQSTVSMEC